MTEGKKTTCPICKLEDSSVEREFDGGERITINCHRCKRFTITRTAKTIVERRNLGPKLSAWIRNRNEQRAEVPLITSETLKDLQTGIPEYSPREKQIKLLQNIERMTAYPGNEVLIVPKYDIPLAWASAEEEFRYYVNSLIGRGLIYTPYPGDFITEAFSVVITVPGWDYLEQRERHIEERTQAFVAMSFSEDLKPIWEGPIFRLLRKPVISHIGLMPNRISTA